MPPISSSSPLAFSNVSFSSSLTCDPAIPGHSKVYIKPVPVSSNQGFASEMVTAVSLPSYCLTKPNVYLGSDPTNM